MIKKLCFALIGYMAISCSSESRNSTWTQLMNDKSFPIQLHQDKVYAFDTLSIAYQNIIINLSKGKMIPIDCEAGTTGVIIFSKGTCNHFDITSARSNFWRINSFIFLRFNPDDYSSVIPLNDAKKNKDENTCKQAWNVIKKYFTYDYNNGYEAVLPPRGNYSFISGDIRITFEAKTSTNEIKMLDQ